jgi:VWFA-related protein
MHAGGTAFYDAVYLAANDVMKDQAGRKAVVMLTDGEDNASKITLAEAIGSAQRADTLAYAVRIADEEQGMMRGFGGPGMGRRGGGGGMERPDGKKVLRQISTETGGAYFEVSKKKPVDRIYAEIEEELRNQYSLGYTSDRADTESGYRKIALAVKQKGLTVQARDGYYAGASSKPS